MLPYDIHEAPPLYQGLVRRWGPPLGIEETRKRWSELVTAAGDGTVTLIARHVPGWGPQWTALVPVTEVADPATACPVWPLLAARKQLGHLVDDAARWPTGRTQLLSNRRTLVAALVPAYTLVDRHGERIDVEDLVRGGGTVTLSFHPGVSGRVDEDGDVVTEPEDEAFVATAMTYDGTEVGSGGGPTIGEAMIRLTRYESGPDPSAGYSDEPPF
ncbi:hypothetical protein [Streptomyces sp. SM12]|uniref:hypothetical protein n=1 Tax=Streptomyces sp. SM12 TaxID=1071602 RepID=UPI000CD5C8C3|nr:hypothetical protein [Streptomyces sp. SM12]